MLTSGYAYLLPLPAPPPHGAATTAESAAKAAAVEAAKATTAVEAAHWGMMMPHRSMMIMMAPHRRTMPVAVPGTAETPENPKDNNRGHHFNALVSQGSVINSVISNSSADEDMLP